MKDEADNADLAELENRVLESWAPPSTSFYETALAINELRKVDRSWSARLLGKVDLSRRRLYDLADVARLISDFKISKDEAQSVGVTKLIKVARHAFEHDGISAHDVREMLEIARVTKAIRLAKVLEGQNPRETKVFVFHLNKTETSLLRETLIDLGAKKAANGG